MTIYSQHPSRGKVQILATYRGCAGVRSSTVTSVESAELAAPIVDALNRISACATVPVSVWDNRDGRFAYYPAEHLVALVDRSARAGLLNGAHSLWYEHVKWLLHQALTDLDHAAEAVPAPVRTAITAELAAEANGLRDALAAFSRGIELPADESRRVWDHEDPFVAFDGGFDGLGHEDRDDLNRMEKAMSDEQLRNAAADLRLLLDAYAQCTNDEAMVLVEAFSITDDPYEFGGAPYFVTVDAPLPAVAYRRDSWEVEIFVWVPRAPDDAEGGAIGKPVLRCTLSAPPTAGEIAELLNRSSELRDHIDVWTKTPVGEPLAGTVFVVTDRY